ncbi:MAG: hypothetical protein ACLTYJ_08660, partial [Merdibacter sp.]
MGLEETNILFVEDDMAACKSLPPILKSYGFKVNTANTFRQAIQEIEANTYCRASYSITEKMQFILTCP